MTGIERLRQFAKGCRLVGQKTFSNAIGDIADQIEHEQDAMVADSPYDALPPEDREAIAWVRDHGGIDYVKREWRSRVPYDLYERKRQRLLDHIAECETALGRRRVRIEELGHRFSDLVNENVELRRRAMPDGMEWLLEVWPRWSNGEYCRFGDWWTADRYGDYEPRKLRRLVIYTPELLDEWEQGDGESYGYEWDFMRPSELDYRPDKAEPAVPAADGEPLEVGQTVWEVDGTGHPFKVVSIRPSTGRAMEPTVVTCDAGDGTSEHILPSQLTHQRPVLDADGVPVKVGDHGWWVEQPGVEIVVKHIDPDECDQLTVCDVHGRGNTIGADEFTHTKPEPSDSWESIEEDARGLDSGVDRELFTHTHEDLVRRCRALAERGE